MKVWVCRDPDGGYVVYREKCKVVSDCWGYFRCPCNQDHEILSFMRSRDFKSFFGIPRHLKKGTKKLMDWTMPLAGDKPAGK